MKPNIRILEELHKEMETPTRRCGHCYLFDLMHYCEIPLTIVGKDKAAWTWRWEKSL